MVNKIVLDKMIKNAKQGKVGKVSKAVGDEVKLGEKIMQVESVKGNTIVKSKFNGVIKLIADEGTNVKIGAVLAEVEVAD